MQSTWCTLLSDAQQLQQQITVVPTENKKAQNSAHNAPAGPSSMRLVVTVKKTGAYKKVNKTPTKWLWSLIFKEPPPQLISSRAVNYCFETTAYRANLELLTGYLQYIHHIAQNIKTSQSKHYYIQIIQQLRALYIRYQRYHAYNTNKQLAALPPKYSQTIVHKAELSENSGEISDHVEVFQPLIYPSITKSSDFNKKPVQLQLKSRNYHELQFPTNIKQLTGAVIHITHYSYEVHFIDIPKNTCMNGSQFIYQMDRLYFSNKSTNDNISLIGSYMTCTGLSGSDLSNMNLAFTVFTHSPLDQQKELSFGSFTNFEGANMIGCLLGSPLPQPLHQSDKHKYDISTLSYLDLRVTNFNNANLTGAHFGHPKYFYIPKFTNTCLCDVTFWYDPALVEDIKRFWNDVDFSTADLTGACSRRAV